MPSIETFIFMDFGTVRGDSKNLTEVALLAVPRSQFHQPENKEEPENKKVWNLRLNGFDTETFEEINDFINQQQKPVCLISHNGHKFDFIILKRELERLNVSLSHGVLCADCLYIFYDILKDDSKNDDSTNIESAASNQLENQIPETGVEDSIYPSTSNVNDTADISNQTADYLQDADSQGLLEEDLVDENLQMQNETTPQKRKLSANNEPINVKKLKLDQRDHQNNGNAKQKLEFNESPKYTGRAIRKIFNEGFPTPPKGYYSLGAIYDREVIEPPVDHHPAGTDVVSKFRISHKLGSRFLAWTDQIQYEFAEVNDGNIVFKINANTSNKV